MYSIVPFRHFDDQERRSKQNRQTQKRHERFSWLRWPRYVTAQAMKKLLPMSTAVLNAPSIRFR